MRHNNENNENNENNRKILGGKIIGSGGFGCVFSPALTCQNSKKITNNKKTKNKISKLMTERHAVKEFEEIQLIQSKLQSIPNYTDYFLLNNSNICRPKKLTTSDMSNFQLKCKALKKEGITKKNINSNLSKLMILNMPNGGIPIDVYMFNQNSIVSFQDLNKNLIKLLLNGIIPMNKKTIYHCDIKDSNVLVKEDKDLLPKLIDWGLSTDYVPFKNNKIPTTWKNRPLQFNVPFSVIIFSDLFSEKYKNYIKNDGIIDRINLKPFVIDFLHLWMIERGSGHYKFINDIMFILFSNDLTHIPDDKKAQFIESNFTIHYISSYIAAIIEKFAKVNENNSLNLSEYLDNVFIKIVDIYGFICIYYPLLELLFENYNNLNKNQLDIFKHIKMIFITYLYSERVEPINIDELVYNLEKLGKLIGDKSNSDNRKARGIQQPNKTINNKTKNNKTINNKTKNNKTKNNILVSKLDFTRKRKFKTKRLKKYLLLS
jgi:hypothetical protein